MKNVWEEALFNLSKAAEAMDLEPEILERLSVPMRFTEFTIPVRMDNGARKLFLAFRSCHQDATGPTKDGTRVRPGLTPEEIKALSLFMSIKHGVAGIPAGGGKGGIRADPSALSEGEYERLIRGFIRRLNPKGAFTDIPGADIGTGKQAMAWMLDEYEQMTGMHCPAAINDKPAELGGSLGGFEATGWGVAACTGKAAEEMNLEPGRTPVVIQGFGQVGSVAAKKLSSMGFPVTAVSDIAGAVENPGGLDIGGLAAHVERTGSVAGFPGGRNADKGRILEIPCGILIPAAVQDVITAENALRIQAKVIVEAANAPVSPEADDMLASAGIRVIPDVVANSGGAIVCDFERTQGLSNDYWSLDKVEERLNGRILTAYREAAERAAERKVSMRRGAWINAMGKIRAAMLLRGWC